MEKMTQERVAKYADLGRELAEVLRDVEKLRAAVPRAADVVEGSEPVHPYVKHKILIDGLDPAAVAGAEAQERPLLLRALRIRDERAAIKAFVLGIQDVKARMLIEFRYLKGMTLRETATRAYGAPAFEDAARMRIARFFADGK